MPYVARCCKLLAFLATVLAFLYRAPFVVIKQIQLHITESKPAALASLELPLQKLDIVNLLKSSHAFLSFDPLDVGYLYLMVVTLPTFCPSSWNTSAAINLGKLD